MRAGIAVAVAAAVGAGAQGGGPHDPGTHGPVNPDPTSDGLEVRMEGRFFVPGRVTALVGETVTWINDDSTTHDVSFGGPDGESGRLAPGARFSHAFGAQGVVRYRCTLHSFMRGTVEVFALALRGPAEPVRIGRAAMLSGRVPASSGPVTVERRAEDGAWLAESTVTPDADGTYAVRVEPTRSTVYRARAGALASAPTRVMVSARLGLSARRRNGSSLDVTVRADPPQPGAQIVLERYVRERFDWRPVARTRLNSRSTAHVRLRTPHRERLRAVMPRGVRGFGSATSPQIVVRGARHGVSGGR